MVLSRGFRRLISRPSALQATEFLAFTLVGLPPTEHASLRWTHNRTCDFHRIRLSRERRCTLTRPFPFLTEPQWHQRQSLCLCPLWLQGQFCHFFSLSWQAFTMSRTLHPGIRLLRRLRPPSHTLAFSRPHTRQGGVGVPQFQSIRRIEIPVAACCRPGACGKRMDIATLPIPRTVPVLGQVYQPISPV